MLLGADCCSFRRSQSSQVFKVLKTLKLGNNLLGYADEEGTVPLVGLQAICPSTATLGCAPNGCISLHESCTWSIFGT